MHASCTTECLTFNVYSEPFVVAIGFRERRSNLARRIARISSTVVMDTVKIIL